MKAALNVRARLLTDLAVEKYDRLRRRAARLLSDHTTSDQGIRDVIFTSLFEEVNIESTLKAMKRKAR